MKKYHVKNMFKMLMSAMVLSVIAGTSYAASVTVMQPYVRAVPQGQTNSAAFMTLKNTSGQDHALVKAKSNISNKVELHTHKMENGMMRMRQVDKILVKANSETVLKPGGLHVMFIGLKQQLTEGDNVDLELEFDDGTVIKLKVPVKMVAGMHMKGMHK